MADREGLSVAPGQVYIEVEYDYEYKAKDRTVTIRQGECYLLVKKTNEDWWQVRKDEGAKAFYVPAQYVREVRRALMPPPLQKPALRAKPTVLDICRASDENLNRPQPEMTSFGRPSPSSTPSPSSDRVTPPVLPKDANQNLGSPHHCKVVAELVLLHNNNNHHHGNSSTLPRTRADSPPLKVGNDHNRSPDSEKMSPPSDPPGGLDKLRNDSESGDELSSSSTEHMQTTSPTGQGRSDSPVYTNLQELKISQSSLPPVPSGSPLHILGDWETHKDLSGRHFYYNRATGERTWKPPRTRDASGSTSSFRGDSQGTWIKHVDEQGRPYYYSADGSRSEWELPKYNISPQSGEIPKSRSLERKQQDPIVLTKWRHSTYVLDLNEKPSEKCGVLNVTKITENGKKVRKNWTSSWTVLQGSSLLFAKGQGGGTSWVSFPSASGPFPFPSSLFGRSSRSSLFHLCTRQGTELLIQSEIDSVINDWFRALTETITTHAWESDEAIEEDMPESPGAEKQDKEKDHRDSKKNRVMKTSVSMDSSDQKKTRMKLKKFLTRRPTYQAVRDKGYIKDQVFGCSLTSLCQRENTTVPNFVKMCIEHVENTGLSIDGLYRVSGNLAVIQKLRFAVNHDEKVDLNDSKWEDIHVTTGALKMLFRELPEPLFTYGAFNDFVNAIKCSDYKQRVNSIKDLIKKLPKPNHDTMQVLFKHLRRVIDHGEANRMTTQSVAIVFGPTLLRPETETGNIAVHMVYQNQIVELILLEYESVFGR
uniref:Rho GTPase activating protein 12b n=1 Tax=Sphaeramia orbicularis TaxID=375764 RepID=A0A673B5D9_9TELE